MHYQNRQGAARQILGAIQTMTVGGTADLLRTVFDCKHKSDTDFSKVTRREGVPATNDKAVDEAYDYSGDVYNFYNEVYARNSIDDRRNAAKFLCTLCK